EERAAGADGERQILDAKARERRGAELLQEAPFARVHIKVPCGQACGEVTVEMHAFGNQDFGWADAPQLIAESLRRDLSDAQRAAREREPGETDGALVPRQREQDVVGLVVEER